MDLWVVKMSRLAGEDCINFRSKERIKRKNDGTLREKYDLPCYIRQNPHNILQNNIF